MLTLTENAVMAIRDIAAQQGAPDTGGIRICADQSAGAFTLATADGPDPDDQVIENQGARAFLDADAARLLDSKALDAGVDEQGDVEFSILDRPRGAW